MLENLSVKLTIKEFEDEVVNWLDSEDLADGLKIDVDFSGLYASIVWDY